MRTVVLALLLAASAPPASSEERDPAFDTDGFVRLGFQAVEGIDEDRAVLGCSGPQGTFLVTGFASGGKRLVTARLRDDGTLDPGFGFEGKASYSLPAGTLSTQRGLCRPDGGLLVAYELVDEAGDGDLHLILLDPVTGAPDPGFGGGHVVIDLDGLVANPGQLEVPLSLQPGAGGDTLLAGQYDDATGVERGFVLRLDADGALQQTHFSLHDATIRQYTAVGTAEEGEVWVLAEHQESSGGVYLSLSRLDAVSLDRVSAINARFGEGLVSSVGRMISDRAMGVGAYPGGAAEGGVFAVVSEQAVQLHTLPAPEAGAVVRPIDIIPLAHGRVLLGADTYRALPPTTARPLYFARFRPGSNGLSFDRSFGEGGVLALARPLEPCVKQSGHRRLTSWQGRPVSVGHVALQCDGEALQTDYQVLRFREGLRGDGFE